MDIKTYKKIFFTTLYISSCTFGGGFVILSFLKKTFVEDLKWISEEEMLDLASLAQSAPGAIAVNSSILIGYKVAGIKGALVSVLGTIIPPLLIICLVSYFYSLFRDNLYVNLVMKGAQAGISAIILDVFYNMFSGLIKEKSILALVLFVLVFIGTYFLKINVAYLILACGLLGALKIFGGEKNVN